MVCNSQSRLDRKMTIPSLFEGDAETMAYRKKVTHAMQEVKNYRIHRTACRHQAFGLAWLVLFAFCAYALFQENFFEIVARGLVAWPIVFVGWFCLTNNWKAHNRVEKIKKQFDDTVFDDF